MHVKHVFCKSDKCMSDWEIIYCRAIITMKKI